MKILVLCGGYSYERNVSLASGVRIANALRERGHEVACLDLYLGTSEKVAFTTSPAPFPTISSNPPDLIALRKRSGNGEALIGRGVLTACQEADAVFLALHGGIGEDGRLQALLDSYGIRYTGVGSLSSMLAMDKALTRTLLAAGGIAVARGRALDGFPAHPDDLGREIGFPCVIKPCRGGSSVGVSIAESAQELTAALTAAFALEDRVLVEERLVGRELTVGILNGRALPPVEILPKQGFYDYKNKYLPDRTLEICPAPLTEAENTLLAATALRAASLLRIDRYCRVDFILSKGVPYCLEINTLPGMTPTSLLPQEAAAVGISYTDLCLSILEEAYSFER